MLKRLVNKVLRRRHYWRDISFDELSELYTSMMFRNLALSLVGIFVPIYLYNLGFSFATIMGFFAVFFAVRIPADFVAGWLVARYGPKRTMFVSYVLYVLALGMFTSITYIEWPLYMLASIWGVSNSVFFIAFHTNFSKIKHREHSGKEISVLNIMERIGATLGPLVGGVVAVLFGAQYTFLTATIFFIFALIPLFVSGEATRTGQVLDYNGLDIRALKHDFISHTAFGIGNTINVMMWPLFLGLFVVADDPYLKIGILSSFAVVVSVVLARIIGRLVDDRKGRRLLRLGASASAIINFIRPFVGSFGIAAAVNFINEITTIYARLPYVKGLYDRADDLEGHRIVYIVSLESFSSMCKSVLYVVLLLLALNISPFATLTFAFVIASVASIFIMSEKYPALDQKQE